MKGALLMYSKWGAFGVLLLWSSLGSLLWATHQKAAEISFSHVSGYTYKATITTYTFTDSPADREALEILWGDGFSDVLSRSAVEVYPEIKTKKNVYYGTHTYGGPGMYYLSMEDPNRNGGVVNMPNSINTPMYVQTLLVISPYFSGGNDTPILLNRPIDDKACVGRRFIHNPGAYDKQGDSLSYKLTFCRTTGGEKVVGYKYPAATDSFSVNEKTGDVLWVNPIEQGEYNVALLIEEWRNQRKISEMTRDMQIVVQTCSNYPPDIFCEEAYCVEAGKTVLFDLYTLDGDANYPKISFSSEIADKHYPTSLNLLYQGSDSASYQFAWKTALANSRAQPYVVYFKAIDRGEPPLSDLKTVFVHVLAPAVEGLEAKSAPEEVHLRWNKTQSTHAIGYKLYRKQGQGRELRDSCTGGVGQEYRLIASLASIYDTNYIDRDSMTPGMSYCYRVIAYFADGAQSYASEQVCASIQSYRPVITQVSVLSTGATDGKIQIAWRRTLAMDSLLASKVYELKKGFKPDSLWLLGHFEMDSIVQVVDTLLNTEGHPYYYQVGLADKNTAEEMAYKTSISSSLFLQATPFSRRVVLEWSFQHPWINERFCVYRLHPDSLTYEPIAWIKDLSYTDRNLENERTYSYYVEGIGTYYSPLLPSPLLNASNTVKVKPQVSDPCKPYVFVESQSCFPLSNTLFWTFDSLHSKDLEDCYADISYYRLYYRRYGDPDFTEIAQPTESRFYHENPSGYLSCYRVSAVNTMEVEGPLSEEMCVDNRGCFSYRLPNVFTPNGDGFNDKFRALPNQYVEGFKIDIVNRWGGQVYSSRDPKFEWDGRFGGNGKECPEGVYFYVVEFTSQEEGITKPQYQSGSVTVLR